MSAVRISLWTTSVASEVLSSLWATSGVRASFQPEWATSPQSVTGVRAVVQPVGCHCFEQVKCSDRDDICEEAVVQM
jgi:hypothetical protein